MQNNPERTSVLLPVNVRDQLIAKAKENERSLAAEIRLAIRAHLNLDAENGDGHDEKEK
jgi:hypothetical protein